MKQAMKKTNFALGSRTVLWLGLIVCVGLTAARAQTPAFTYQGRFTDSTVAQPTSGTYNMQFGLHSAEMGAALIQTLPAVDVVVSGGVFTVNLNFTAANAFDGNARFLEIAVRRIVDPQNPPAFIILTPRQPLTSSPYSIRAKEADAANSLSAACVLCVTDAQISGIAGTKIIGNVANADNATIATTAGTANNALSLGGISSNGYLRTTGGTISGNLTIGGTITGDGSGLTNLPTSGFAWQEVTGTTQQAVSNKGYIANNNAAGQVTITLPAAPNVGDVVRLSGAGAGGWRISQNVNQFVSANSISTSPVFRPRESNRDWHSIASSADGVKLAAVVFNGQIYTSIDSGATWTVRESNRPWRSIASSADGVKLAAVVSNGQIHTATYSETTIGTGGYLTGGILAHVELQYVGGGRFVILSREGEIAGF